MCQECHREVFWARYCSSCTPLSFQENKLIGYADDSTFVSFVPSLGVRVTLAMNGDLGKVSERCNLWALGNELNANKTIRM